MLGKMFTRPARDLATTSTSQFQPGPSSRRLFKRSLTFVQKVQVLKHFFRRSHSQEEVKDACLQENTSPEPSFQGLSHSSEDFDGMCDDLVITSHHKYQRSHHEIQVLKHFFRQSHSQEEVKDACLQENASPEPSFQGWSHSSEDFDGMTQGDPQHQVPHLPSPALTPSPTDLGTVSPVQAEDEGSATSTPPTTVSAPTSLNLATPKFVSMAPTSTLPSSLHTFKPHPDLLAVNQRIVELEAIAKQVEQEHADYVKEAREMDATLTSLKKEVDLATEEIKNLNRKTALEDEQCMELHHMWCDEVRAISKAEGDPFWAKHEYEVGQKKYAKLQVRFENLQREQEQRRMGTNDAGPLPPNEPWLEVLSAAVAGNLLAGVAMSIGHIPGPLLPNAF
ncbi:hypothetical protein M407DRAFT_29973 [Tulasnella calospora MUT 4182]|uniref:Uncharacterized protein n=1 Tax=Tulasnella calospora MUT 4182 TaxID=1051891 RepID=A0A0C3Q857_9AGAM|nr:hypothetical protein M407DRAFT_29973 [Tulasnella calospora MUT 4182]